MAISGGTGAGCLGDDQGLDDIERLIDLRIDTKEITVPHRIYGYNNIYDEFAYAVYLFRHSGRRVHDQKRIYSKLLELYGPCGYEWRLKSALLESGFRDLLPDVERACRRALAADRVYLASQLLPVTAKWVSERVWSLIPLFLRSLAQTPNPVAHVAVAL